MRDTGFGAFGLSIVGWEDRRRDACQPGGDEIDDLNSGDGSGQKLQSFMLHV